MNLQQLRYIVAVAQLGTMTRAAQALHIGQPALSQAIQAMERELGTPLFERTRRGVVLTDAGRVLVGGATRALTELDAAVERVSAMRGAPRATVVVAARPAAARVPGVDLVRAIRRARPDVVVRVVAVESTGELVDLVAAGDVDVGITDLPGPVSGLVAHAVATHDFVAYLPPGSRCDTPSITSTELARYPLIGAPTDPRWRAIDQWFLGAGAAGDVVVEVNRRDLVLPMVAAGLGATVNYAFLREEAERMGIVVVDLEPTQSRTVWAVRSGRPLSEAAEDAWLLITAADAGTSRDGDGSQEPAAVQ